ncbi:hypothetical protein O181_100283, partial [Austropuccinia psidii MF-1]|nr:hypothetical protein [Austropuccinia psidii MF-1]
NILISIALNIQKLAHKNLQINLNHSRSSKISSSLNQNESSHLLTSNNPIHSNHPNHHYNLKSKSSWSYLSSPIWWSGLILMSTGEFGNFLSYGFAPASVVAPLGTVALISNCLFAPLLLGEKFKNSDLIGIGLAVLGTFMIIINSPPNTQSLSPLQLQKAFHQPAFLIFGSISLFFIFSLISLSQTKWVDQFLIIDVGLCAILGGFTVLSTKAFSSLLSTMLLDCFKYTITWLMILIMILTAILQIIFLNQALQRFDSKHVVPVQFVLFTITAIIGSLILYQDFENLRPTQVIDFAFACGLIFTGVYILTNQKSLKDIRQDHSSQPQSDIDPESRLISPEPTKPRGIVGTPVRLADLDEDQEIQTSCHRQGSTLWQETAKSIDNNTGLLSTSTPTPTLRRSRSRVFLEHQLQRTPSASTFHPNQNHQRSRISFPRPFGAPGYYLIASSSSSSFSSSQLTHDSHNLSNSH